ncbi:hypothetical protein BKA65DRAFT_549316 [Rhexocercosporidium sp. MPI-PUGE-AT-0058]|nr:hypothetical protein BKA65DRAFT_549316 [Rhexocercosporidium sp. MPI-PUGE-AT-0058]
MEGYAKLANLMGHDHADGHFLIFQKFEPLSAQNLLYLQSELINLQESLHNIVQRDSESEDPEKLLFAKDWEALSSATESAQWQIWLEIRTKLKEYYEAISQHRMMTSLPAPSSYDLKFLQQWLERPGLGNCALVGADSDVYENHKKSGLVTLAARQREVDAMTRLFVDKLPKLFHWVIVHPLHRFCGWWIKKPVDFVNQVTSEASSTEEGQPKGSHDTQCASTAVAESTSSSAQNNEEIDLESNMFLYRDSHIYRIATILGTLLSSLIPIAAIIILSFVKNMTARLGIVSAFTAIFSVSLSLVTEGKRVEIFAATAAFASVQVVFIGSTNWNQG